MEVSVESTSAVERKLTIVVPANQADDKVNAKVREMQKQARIAGFRPGKVPEREVRRRFGAGIRQEILAEVIQNAYAGALEQQALNPVDAPKISVIDNSAGQDVKFEAVLEVMPAIELPELDGLAVERVTTDIDDNDVDAVVTKILEQRADWVEKEGAAESGDRLKFDYEGISEGEAFEGGTASDQTLELGSNSMIPGFEDQLVGVSAGDKRTLSVTFPEDYQAEALRGKAAEFHTTIHAVETKQMPELDDALFKQFGVNEGGEAAFRTEVRKNMEHQRQSLERQIFSNNATIELVKNSTFDVPQALVVKEAKNLRDKAIQQVFGNQMPEQLKNNPDALPYDGFMGKAEHSVRSGLLLVEIISQNEIKVTDEQRDAKLNELCASYEDPEQMKALVKNNAEQMSGVEQQVLEELVLDFIASKASLTEVKLSFEALSSYEMKEPEVEQANQEGEPG